MSSSAAQPSRSANQACETKKRYRLESATAAVDFATGKRVSMLPAGAVVECTGEPSRRGAAMVDVYFNGHALSVFAIDLQQRGRPVD